MPGRADVDEDLGLMAAISETLGRSSRGVLARLRSFSRFLRLSAIGATIVMPLTGAVTSGLALSLRQAVAIGVVGALFHVFGYVLNDVVDLPIDRTEPRRQGSPLVEGTIGRGTALAVALGCVPAMFAVAVWLPAGGTALAALAVAIVSGAAYDLWSKRVRAPVVMDLVQGISWAGIGMFGAAAAGAVTTTTVALMVFFVTYILMANGVHGALRDIVNDSQHGALTTAILFGVEPSADGGVRLTRALRRYAIGLQVAMAMLAAAMLRSLDYRGATAVYGVVAWAVTTVGAFALLRAAIAASERRASLMVLGTLHLIATLGVVIAILFPAMPPALRFGAIAVYVTPLLTYGWLIDAVRRVTEPRDPR